MLRWYSHFSLEPDNMSEEEFIKNVEAMKFCLKEIGQYTER